MRGNRLDYLIVAYEPKKVYTLSLCFAISFEYINEIRLCETLHDIRPFQSQFPSKLFMLKQEEHDVYYFEPDLGLDPRPRLWPALLTFSSCPSGPRSYFFLADGRVV